MAIVAKDFGFHTRRVMIISIRTIYRSVRAHPVLSSLGLFLLVLYNLFPSLFAFLVSSSPVLICTTLLLGTLLSFGEPNIPEIEEEKTNTREVSSLKAGPSSNDLRVHQDESVTSQSHVRNGLMNEESPLEESAFSEETDCVYSDGEEHVPLVKRDDERDEKDDSCLAAIHSVKNDVEMINVENLINKERDVHGLEKAEKIEDPVEKQDEVGEAVHDSPTTNGKEVEDLGMGIDKPEANNEFGFSLGSPWQRISDHDDVSDSESDRAESSSPDASMADIIPMLDELHPLLDSESAPPNIKHISASASDHESDDYHDDDDDDDDDDGDDDDDVDDDESVEEGAENNGAEENKEVEGKKEDENEAVVSWTADDQKNLMDLGSSELERNRRLESLIAKRRARKNFRFDLERNLIDLNGNDSMELSRFRLAPISAPRGNPFDLPYDSEETMDLPPIPGSAPSVLLPRGNPFDLPYDQPNGSDNALRETWSPRETFVSVPQREMLFRRHESFNVSGGELRQERRASMLRPYFVAENMESEERTSATFNRQYSDKSDSKLSSVPESDTVSSVTDLDYNKDFVEQEFHPEDENENLPLDEVEAAVVERETNEEFIVTNDHEIHLNNHMNVEETQQNVQFIGSLEENHGEAINLSSTISDAGGFGESEEKHEDLISTSLSEATTKGSMKFHDRIDNLEVARNSMLLGRAASDLISWEDKIGDNQLTEVVYDSSPPATEKSLSNVSALNEVLFDAGKSSLNASSSLESNMEMNLEKEFSEVGDFPSINTNLVGEMASDDGKSWAASSSIPLIDGIESKSREIGESNVSEVGLSTIHVGSENYIIHQLSSDLMESNSSSTTLIDIGDVHQKKVDGLGDQTSNVDNLLSSDDLISSVPPYAAHFEMSLISSMDLHPIPEEKVEDFKSEKDQNSKLFYDSLVGLTGLQVIGGENIHASHIEQELSFIDMNYVVGSGNHGDGTKLISETDEGGSLFVPPLVPVHNGSTVLKYENVIGSGIDLIESGDLIDLVQSRLEGSSSKYLDDSNEELHVFEAWPGEELNSLVKQIYGGVQVSSVLEPTAKVEVEPTEFGLRESGPEVRETDLEMLVFEARSIEDVGSAFEHLSTGRDETKILEVGVSEVIQGRTNLELIDVNPETRETDSESPVLKPKSIEELESAFEHLSKGLDKTNISEVGSPEVIAGRLNLEKNEINSDLQVVEAKSVDGLHEAFKQLSGEAEAKNGSGKFEENEKHIENDVPEVQPAEEIELASEAALISETGRHLEKEDERNDEVAAITAVVGSNSKKTGKKHKSRKSRSSSSSSSSDSE
uniref:Uncharacterized protein n=1 Tax=Ananas comosus var. bracteatus TaxID=296719 RepID=A0A6V7NG47_ANACO|nr:unnamed protein product [Ananas comosus var. bracteatus]